MRLKTLLADLLRSFVVLPGLIAASCAALAFALRRLDEDTWAEGTLLAVVLPEPSIDATRVVLSSIATSTITVVSLVYSLTLVVFTLAASSIAPRLLERFMGSRSAQITAGLFTGTFLYCLVVLLGIDAPAVPRLSLFGGAVLITVAVTSLIVFIRQVSRQITVDAEISRITAAIGRELDSLGRGDYEGRSGAPDDEEIEVSGRTVSAHSTGYVLTVEVEPIVRAAAKHDAIVELGVGPGDFVIEGMPIATVSVERDTPRLTRAIRDAVPMGSVRTPEGDPAFSVHLLVEIALRALSAGVNDAYTAIACIDHLSAAFVQLLGDDPPPPVRRDRDGKARLIVPGLNARTIFEAAWHPLRRGAQGNVSVTLALVAALTRLAVVADRRHVDLLARHLDLVADDAERTVANTDDLGQIREQCAEARANLSTRVP